MYNGLNTFKCVSDATHPDCEAGCRPQDRPVMNKRFRLPKAVGVCVPEALLFSGVPPNPI